MCVSVCVCVCVCVCVKEYLRANIYLYIYMFYSCDDLTVTKSPHRLVQTVFVYIYKYICIFHNNLYVTFLHVLFM